MVFRSFVLYGSSLRIPTPQGIGTGGEVGTPAALVAQRPNDDAGMVLGPLEQVPGTVEELITPGLLRLRRRLADEANMVFWDVLGTDCTTFFCAQRSKRTIAYIYIHAGKTRYRNMKTTKTHNNMSLEVSP